MGRLFAVVRPDLHGDDRGRPFEWLPSDRKLSPEQEQELALRMRELDTIAARLEAGDPGSAAKAEADRERRRSARQLEKEQAARKPEVARAALTKPHQRPSLPGGAGIARACSCHHWQRPTGLGG